MEQKDLNKFLAIIERHRRERKEADDGSIFDGEQGHIIDKLLSAYMMIEDKLIMVLSQRVGWTPKHEQDTIAGLLKRLVDGFNRSD